ncbi:MAG: UDP-N-acetylglucosamine 1-carboxyvinyltransferase [Lachnospiraceae bacterium]|nr:UDP-N-acetylglucosamine 1-carboxyvinyltransferase [Lachnospiraceae bacterium]
METVRVMGGSPLQGETKIRGSKNAVLPLLAASVLIQGECVLEHVPAIQDVEIMTDLLQHLGCRVIVQKDTLIINAEHITESHLPREAVSRMRSSIILLGPVLARCEKAVIYQPGGCTIGKRPVDLHVAALQQMGTKFMIEGERMEAVCNRLQGCDIRFPFVSVGATQNAILAAVTARGTTWIRNAAREPEIVTLCNLLRLAGARISGAGTGTVVVHGVEKLYQVSYTVPADRIVAGTYMIGTVAAGGTVFLRGAPWGELRAVSKKLEEIGAVLQKDEQGIRVCAKKRPKSCPFLKTDVYPGFSTDFAVAYGSLAGEGGRYLYFGGNYF